MNSIDHFVDLALERRGAYRKCPDEQGLVYACEDTVDDALGSPVLANDAIVGLVTGICWREDLEPPLIRRTRATTTRASADLDTWSICVAGRRTTSSVLVHELAHLSVGVDSHGVLFRDELVRLTRAHISVHHGSLLHTLFTRVGLEMSPWAASAHRRGEVG